VTADEVPDPQRCGRVLSVNGEKRPGRNTKNRACGPSPRLVRYVSQFMVLTRAK